MPSLYESYLPIAQDLSSYGGNPLVIHITKSVLDAIDAKADAGNTGVAVLRGTVLDKMAKWSGLHDHSGFSAIVEAYYEAVFLLVAGSRGLSLSPVASGSDKGKTPDFATLTTPTIGFEIKTIDFADPKNNYKKTMEDGLDAAVAAREAATPGGIGFAEQIISPHADTDCWKTVIEQIMKKIDGNVKSGQYQACPTFLVASAIRSSLNDRAPELSKFVPPRFDDQASSGHLFTVAAHKLGEPFYYYAPSSIEFEDLGPLERAGILRDHQFIAGLIFLQTEWNRTGDTNAFDVAFRFNGIWNTLWERSTKFDAPQIAEAKRVFKAMCHAENDTENTRGSHLTVGS